MILGIDEVGRGAWAGPLVVGAVVLGGTNIDGLTDSKKLTKSQRVRLDAEIREKASGFGLGWVAADELDKVGLSQALVLATRRAVEQVKAPYHEIIIDGTVNFLAETGKGKFVTTMKQADLLVPCVSAASIIAKVARDNYMTQMAKENPGYDFEKHVGYGTSAHSNAIKRLGIINLHRKSFKPIISATKVGPTVVIGNNAEDIAAGYLRKNGWKVVDRNWKTKYCEIDIVATKKSVYYFVEVKYRKNSNQGGGLDAITKKKLNQMKFAANYYIQANNLQDMSMRLAVISLSGNSYDIDDFIEL